MRDWLTTELILTTLLVTSFTCMGLLAIWAATSPWHWFIRAVVVTTVLSAPLLIPAYEPLLVFVIQMAVAAIGAKIWHWRMARPRECARKVECEPVVPEKQAAIHFSLTTLLLLTPLVAVIAAIVARVAKDFPSQNTAAWSTLVLNGFVSGCAVLVAAWLFYARRRRIAWLASLGICLCLAAVMAWFDWLFVSVGTNVWPPDPQTSSFFLAYAFKSHPELAWFVVLPAIASVTCLVLYLWSYGASQQSLAGGARINGIHLKWRTAAVCALTLLLMLLAAPTAFIYWKLLHPITIPTFYTPDPNGLEDIVAAGRDFQRSPILSTAVEPKSTDELAAEITKYAASYDRLRLGLSRPIRARSWPHDDMLTAFNLSIDYMQYIRSCARGLMREAELALQQDRSADAARISLENFRLAHAISQDGLLVDCLVGIAIEGIGEPTLYRAVSKLEAAQCREMIAALLQIERDRESLEDVLYRDRIWSEHAFGWTGHFFLLMDDVAQASDVRRASRQVFNRREAVTRLLIVELALRAYQIQYAELPDRLGALTPEFLPQLPTDPFDPAGWQLRFVRSDNGFVGYSVGVDGDDDGGRPPIRNEDGWIDFNDEGDLRLDVYLAAESDSPMAIENDGNQVTQGD